VSISKPERRLSKSKFSMYLRTQCDRELYLSLYSNDPPALEAAGIPAPLKSRPGVQLITNSGKTFEYEQYDFLVSTLPNHVVHKDSGRDEVNLAAALAATPGEGLILQPAIDPQSFRGQALGNLGLSAKDQALVPPLAGLIPDVLYVHAPIANEHEILPDGARKRIEVGDARLGISVVDLKNVTEANASYSAEVCLYAFFLTSWLALAGKPLTNKFYVSDRIYLWKHIEMPTLAKVMKTKAGGNHANRLAALWTDLQEGLVDYLVYMPSVRKFFREDLPRVVNKGDTEGWAAVPYHVNPRCGACDWLGNKDWLIGKDLATYTKHPDHYCAHSAEITDHLSKIANLSKGASHILGTSGHTTVKQVAGIQSTAPVLRKHALLKKDRLQIGARATALGTGQVSFDDKSPIGGLARNVNAEHQIVVNFDAGTGLIAGIGVRSVAFAPYQQFFDPAAAEPQSFLVIGAEAFVVPKDNASAEWATVQAFIECLASWIEHIETTFAQRGWGKPKTQISFWEVRQYDELCNAFGRHLLSVLQLGSKYQRALAWIFPAEQLMEKDDELCPGLIFVRDIVSAALRLPVRFATTLLSTVKHYHHPNMSGRFVDKYFEDPLGNGIPRERIFEIWKSTTGTVQSYGKAISIQDAIKKYGDVLNAQTWALASIARQLRMDLKSCIRGNAPALTMSVPQGIQGVAYDSKLWAQWAKVSAAATETEDKLGLIARSEALEASYKAIVLVDVVKKVGKNTYEFEVSEDSTEAKIEEGDAYCAVGKVASPGFPLLSAASMGLPIQDDPAKLRSPFHRVIAATLVAFDRVNRRATVSFHARNPYYDAFFDSLLATGILPVGTEQLYLLDAVSYDDSDTTVEILRNAGNPQCAKTAPEALAAMGKSAASKLPAGTDANTPMASVLWDAATLSKSTIRTTAQAKALRAFATTANKNPLNPSQADAVEACGASQLAIVWGPPGTGKTDTLTALVHAVVREKVGRKILLTGPNYRAVEELAGRVLANLDNDSKSRAQVFWVYSRSREPKAMPTVQGHLVAASLRLENGSPDVARLLQSLADPICTTIVATTAHMVTRITEKIHGSRIEPLFDLVVLDESSQVDVCLALRPLAGLKPDAQLIVAGDHLQMPPIHRLEAPVGAEYLVGSIQKYMIHRFSIPTQDLLVNYRSNQDLVDYARSLGYPSKLAAHHPIKQLAPIADMTQIIKSLPASLPSSSAFAEILRPERRVVAVIHEDVASSQANEFEAKLVAALAYCIRHGMAREPDLGVAGATYTAFTDDEFFAEGLGIVTPHKAQKALVIRELRALFPAADPAQVFGAVDTVERFQGGERQTIIVSFGVGDVDVIEGEEEFLLQMERTNVAVSRAKSKCVVLMPKSLAYHLPADRKIAQTSVAIKSYIEEFCANRQGVAIVDGTEVRTAEVRWH